MNEELGENSNKTYSEIGLTGSPEFSIFAKDQPQ
jgi:hypothetical protein